jgi:hypothetical protein
MTMIYKRRKVRQRGEFKLAASIKSQDACEGSGMMLWTIFPMCEWYLFFDRRITGIECLIITTSSACSDSYSKRCIDIIGE